MTYTLVNANTMANIVTPGTTITPTCTSTTAGNLLVGVLGFPGGAPGTASFPGGWSSAVNLAGNDPDCQIWYKPNIGAGVTSVAIIWSGSATPAAAQILEFAGGATVTPLDRTGTISSGAASSQAAATSLTITQAHELAVAAYSWDFVSATKATLAAGTGFTQDGQFGTGLKQSFHFAVDHELDTGASSGITVTDTVTDGAVSGVCAAAIATFTLPGAAAAVRPKPLVVTQAVKRAALY